MVTRILCDRRSEDDLRPNRIMLFHLWNESNCKGVHMFTDAQESCSKVELLPKISRVVWK